MMATSGSSPLQEDWFFDTGATHHLADNTRLISDVNPFSGLDQVTIGNRLPLPIHNIGKRFCDSSNKFCLLSLSPSLINSLNVRCWDNLSSICSFPHRVAESRTSISCSNSIMVYMASSTTMYGCSPPCQNVSRCGPTRVWD